MAGSKRESEEQVAAPDPGDMLARASVEWLAPSRERLSTMQAGQSKFGMQTFNQSLASLYLKKQITLEAALSRSSIPDELQELINRGVGVNVPTTATAGKRA